MDGGRVYACARDGWGDTPSWAGALMALLDVCLQWGRGHHWHTCLPAHGPAVSALARLSSSSAALPCRRMERHHDRSQGPGASGGGGRRSIAGGAALSTDITPQCGERALERQINTTVHRRHTGMRRNDLRMFSLVRSWSPSLMNYNYPLTCPPSRCARSSTAPGSCRRRSSRSTASSS